MSIEDPTIPTAALHDPVLWMTMEWSRIYGKGSDSFGTLIAVMRTHQVMMARLDQHLKEQGLSRTGYLVLVSLRMSKNHTRPMGKLSKHLMVHPTTVTMVIDQLENAGWVERNAHPSDRRAVLASLTGPGVKMVDRVSKHLRKAEFAFAGLSPTTVSALSTVLHDARYELGDAV